MYCIKDKDYKGLLVKEGKPLKNVVVCLDETVTNERLKLLEQVSQVMGYEYKGDPSILFQLESTKKPFIVKLEKVDMLGVDIFINRYPSWVTLVIVSNQLDMYDVHQLCQRYENVRVCGGYYFQLDWCRLGCGFSKMKSNILDGCHCKLEGINLAEVDYKDWGLKAKKEGKPSISTNKVEKVTKPKKKSIVSLLSSGGVEF